MKKKALLALLLVFAMLFAACAKEAVSGDAGGSDDGARQSETGDGDSGNKKGSGDKKDPGNAIDDPKSNPTSSVLDTYMAMLDDFSLDMAEDIQFDMDFYLSMYAEYDYEEIWMYIGGNIKLIVDGDVVKFAIVLDAEVDIVGESESIYMEIIFDGTSLYLAADGEEMLFDGNMMAAMGMDMETLLEEIMGELMGGVTEGFMEGFMEEFDEDLLSDFADLFDPDMFMDFDPAIIEAMVDVQTVPAGGGEKTTVTVDGAMLSELITLMASEIAAQYDEYIDFDIYTGDITVEFATDAGGNPESFLFNMFMLMEAEGEEIVMSIKAGFNFNKFGSGVVIRIPAA